MNQPTLFQQRARLAADLAERTVYAILADGKWHRAKSFGLNERVVRAIAERSDGKILGSQEGYKLTRSATVEEVAHVERWLTSQADKMKRRAYEIRQVRAGR